MLSGTVKNTLYIFVGTLYEEMKCQYLIRLMQFIIPPALTALMFTQGHNGPKGDVVSIPKSVINIVALYFHSLRSFELITF